MALGIPQGKQVGFILQKLLDDVIGEKLDNEHARLIEAAMKYKEESHGT